ncbi:unnamed protein product [Prunus brigantina]
MQDFKTYMMQRYEMTDLGLLHHFLGMGIIQSEDYIFIHQKKYASTLLKRFGLQDCKPVGIPLVPADKLKRDYESGAANEAEYKKLVGSLLYLTTTRPDIMYVACLLARFMHSPTNKHYGTTKRVLSDWFGSEDYMKSTSGYAFTFSSGVFSWASVKQQCVALSTAEAEYVSALEATVQATWLRLVLEDFGEMQTMATPLNCDNLIHCYHKESDLSSENQTHKPEVSLHQRSSTTWCNQLDSLSYKGASS